MRHRLVVLALVVLVVLGLAIAWTWSPLRAWLDVDLLVSSLQRFGQSFGPVAAVCGFALALTVAVPLTFLTLVALIAFGPWGGFGCAVVGGLASAALSYGIGRLLGREVVERLAGARINQISQRLARSGLIAVIMVRLVPIAPFAVVNMVAGASHIRLRDLLLGTAIGMSPGALAMTLFVDQIQAAIKHPTALTFVVAGLVVVLVVAAAWGMQRWVRGRE